MHARFQRQCATSRWPFLQGAACAWPKRSTRGRCAAGSERRSGRRLEGLGKGVRPSGTAQEGRCICFDDSFEHEVWHDGPAEGGPRIVLLLRFWHPDIPQSRWDEVVRDSSTAVLQDLAAQLPPVALAERL